MKIIEKIGNGRYIGQKETGIYEGTRFLIVTSAELEEGEKINKNNPIEMEYKTLCELCEEVYGGGEDYSEEMKQQAIDFVCGYITDLEIL